jgi:hypothetical protein
LNVKSRIKEAFYSPDLLQGTADLDALYRQSQKANSNLQKFAAALAAEIGGGAEVVVVPNKDFAVAARKAQDEFGGDVRRLTDLSRICIKVDTVEQIRAAERLFDPERLSPFIREQGRKGYLVRKFSDLFVSPAPSGYRAINAKIEVPLSHGDSHICEVQIQHRGMEEAFKATHALYEESRAITRVFNDSALSDVDAARVSALEAQRRAIHDEAAAGLGLRALERARPPVPVAA